MSKGPQKRMLVGKKYLEKVKYGVEGALRTFCPFDTSSAVDCGTMQNLNVDREREGR